MKTFINNSKRFFVIKKESLRFTKFDNTSGPKQNPNIGKTWQENLKNSLENGYGKYILVIAGAIVINIAVARRFAEILITPEEALTKIKEGQVTKLIIVSSYLRGTPYKIELYNKENKKAGAIAAGNLVSFINQVGTIEGLNNPIEISYLNSYPLSLFILFLAFNLLLILSFVAMSNPKLGSMLFRKTGNNEMVKILFNAKETRAVEYDKSKVNVTFKDVAGLNGPKEEVQQIIDFLKSPNKFKKLGASIPKGVLLAGPPGTGKTLLAKACAGEAGVPFFVASGSEFMEMFVGVGAARVRSLFEKAKSKAPSIVFIDEVDAIGKKRSRYSKDDERESTLNQLFVEMDGFGTNTNVIVMAATNRKKKLDPALIRPGRFDRIIEVSLPDLKEREEIFGVHLRKIVTHEVLNKPELARKLATLTIGMSGAEIMSICNEAALIAARHDKNSVELEDFYEGYDRVLEGLKKTSGANDFVKKLNAYHEAGHATAGWFLKNAQQVLKVSIVPRSKGSLGQTTFMSDELQMYTREQIHDMLKTTYGGRAAEEVFLETSSTKAADDLAKATELAKQYVGKYGMDSNYEFVSFINPKGEFIGSPYAKKVVGTLISSNSIGRYLRYVMKHIRKLKNY